MKTLTSILTLIVIAFVVLTLAEKAQQYNVADMLANIDWLTVGKNIGLGCLALIGFGGLVVAVVRNVKRFVSESENGVK